MLVEHDQRSTVPFHQAGAHVSFAGYAAQIQLGAPVADFRFEDESTSRSRGIEGNTRVPVTVQQLGVEHSITCSVHSDLQHDILAGGIVYLDAELIVSYRKRIGRRQETQA